MSEDDLESCEIDSDKCAHQSLQLAEEGSLVKYVSAPEQCERLGCVIADRSYPDPLDQTVPNGLQLFKSDSNGPRITFDRHEYSLNLQLNPSEQSNAFGSEGSLALLGRNSVDYGRSIMALSEDHTVRPQGQDQQQQTFGRNYKPAPTISVGSNDPSFDENGIIEQLGLRALIMRRKPQQNTKNVLRNLGNAQNQYCLYHPKAREYISERLSRTEPFDTWVRSLRLENFEHFRFAWQSCSLRAYVKVYRQLCCEFYLNNAVPYLLQSRIKRPDTRRIHLKYLFRFLEGLLKPSTFNYFKKAEKDSHE